MWITSDGRFKVEVIHLNCTDKMLGDIRVQHVLIKQWADKAHGWIKLAEICPPFDLAAKELGTWLLEALGVAGVDTSDLVEADNPDWQDDAYNSEGE